MSALDKCGERIRVVGAGFRAGSAHDIPTMWTSSLSLNTRTDGASTTSHGSPFHTLGVLTVRKCFLASKWNLGSLSFAPLERVLMERYVIENKHVAPSVQNISQSMEVLDLRTYRDLQYVRNTESLMKGLDSRLKVATEGQKNLNVKSFQAFLDQFHLHEQVLI
ncbi:Noelin-2 [Varanus komodoensis]|nr:Noelin-2 [Varanus komodoensis]